MHDNPRKIKTIFPLLEGARYGGPLLAIWDSYTNDNVDLRVDHIVQLATHTSGCVPLENPVITGLKVQL